MSYLECPHCDEKIDVFGAGGGQAVASSLSTRLGAKVPLLGQIPIDVRLREGGDSGQPLVLSDPTATACRALLEVTEALSGKPRGLAGMSLGLSPRAPLRPLRSSSGSQGAGSPAASGAPARLRGRPTAGSGPVVVAEQVLLHEGARVQRGQVDVAELRAELGLEVLGHPLDVQADAAAGPGRPRPPCPGAARARTRTAPGRAGPRSRPSPGSRTPGSAYGPDQLRRRSCSTSSAVRVRPSRT